MTWTINEDGDCLQTNIKTQREALANIADAYRDCPDTRLKIVENKNDAFIILVLLDDDEIIYKGVRG